MESNKYSVSNRGLMSRWYQTGVLVLVASVLTVWLNFSCLDHTGRHVITYMMTEEPVTALAYGRHYYCYRLGFVFLNVSVVILRKAAVSFSMPFKLRCGTQPVISFVLLLAYIICKK